MSVSRRCVLTLGGLSVAGLLSGACTTPGPLGTAGTSRPGRGATTAPRPGPSTPAAGGTWRSPWVETGTDGRLTYASARHLRIPDFGHAGYRGGGAPIPDVLVVERLGPAPGDNTSRLQAALDRVGDRTPGPDGFRGALALGPGRYDIAGTLRLARSGVVLRGAGDGDDPAVSTILHAVGDSPRGRAVLDVGGRGSWDDARPGTRTPVTTDVVPLGTTTLGLAATSRLRPGDSVIVVHPCTEEWLAAVDGGGTGTDRRWRVGSVPILYHRRIADVGRHGVTLDAPLFGVLERSLSPCELYAWDRSGLVTQVGVESLRVDIDAAGAEDERHARDAIRLHQVEDAWVRACTVLHFTRAGVLTTSATRVTVADCRAIEPASRLEGERRYNFDVEARSQQILFTRCTAQGGRHSFVSNGGGTVSGIVFHRTTAEGSLASSEGHRRWSQGLLFDNHVETAPRTDRVVLLGNRGDYGTGHGWSAVNSVAWAVDAGGGQVVVQQPPTGQNWAVGCTGTVTGDGPFPAPPGHIEGTDRPGLRPASLYEAQLADRAR